MDDTLARTIELLEALVAFPSVSRAPNLEIVSFVAAYLQRHGVEAHLVYDDTGHRANLFATIGPDVAGGVVLAGHTDVVPTTGQDWALPPFEVTSRDGLLYGRGTTDMKGFLAAALAVAAEAAERPLARPLHLAITYDEEPGSLGAPDLARFMTELAIRPEAVIVGEPTGLRPVAGHKGGLELTTRIEGFACHSSDPRKGVSALAHAMRFIAEIERLGRELAASAPADSPFDPPASTVNVGLLEAGTARNVVAGSARFDWEVRLTPPDDAETIYARVQRLVDERLLPEMRAHFADARIETEVEAAYPGLDVVADGTALALAQRLTGANGHDVVAFGTDAGCFQRAGLPTVVMGPGHIDQAHKPDEFIAVHELERGLGVLHRLVDELERPR
jgi:acetylornithine deacetylase